MKTKNIGTKENLRKAHPNHKDYITDKQSGVQVKDGGKPIGERKKPSKRNSPVGTKGKKKEIAKRPTKNKKAAQPEMGNPGKIVWKRFGM